MLKLYFCINIHYATVTVSGNTNGWLVVLFYNKTQLQYTLYVAIVHAYIEF